MICKRLFFGSKLVNYSNTIRNFTQPIDAAHVTLILKETEEILESMIDMLMELIQWFSEWPTEILLRIQDKKLLEYAKEHLQLKEVDSIQKTTPTFNNIIQIKNLLYIYDELKKNHQSLEDTIDQVYKAPITDKEYEILMDLIKHPDVRVDKLLEAFESFLKYQLRDLSSRKFNGLYNLHYAR